MPNAGYDRFRDISPAFHISINIEVFIVSGPYTGL
jgi:hypothetical protein